MERYKADGGWVIDTLTDTIVTSQKICDMLNAHACELPAIEKRAMSSVEIAKRYGKGGYAFTYTHRFDYIRTSFENGCQLFGICLIDDLCEDVSKSPWFMPMVDESGTVTEQIV